MNYSQNKEETDSQTDKTAGYFFYERNYYEKEKQYLSFCVSCIMTDRCSTSVQVAHGPIISPSLLVIALK